MKMRKLRNLEVSAIGLGCKGLSHGYGAVPERNESVQLIRYAFERGCTHFDTAEGYGAGDNEVLVGEALPPMRNQVVIATKFLVGESTTTNLLKSKYAHTWMLHSNASESIMSSCTTSTV